MKAYNLIDNNLTNEKMQRYNLPLLNHRYTIRIILLIWCKSASYIKYILQNAAEATHSPLAKEINPFPVLLFLICRYQYASAALQSNT